MWKRAAWTAAAVTVCNLGVAAQPAARGDKLTLDTYFEIESVAGPQLSPDGRQIIYTRQSIDTVNDRRDSALWITNADGSRNRALGEGSNARWSPTGDRIAYLAPGKPRGSQVFVRWMDAEGATTQITHVERSPSGIVWSPDGTQIAFSMSVEQRAPWRVEMPRAPEGARWIEPPHIVERLKYRQDRVGFTDAGYRHIFVVPAGGGTARQVTTGNYDHGSPVWTSDSKGLLFSGLRADDAEYQWRESEIYRVDLASGGIQQLTRRKGPDDNPTVSPDGTKVAYTGYDWTRDRWTESHIYVMNADGSNPRLASGNWDGSPSSDLFWSSDSRTVYFTAQSQGHENLYALPLAGDGAGVVRPVTRGVHMLEVTDLLPSGQAVGVVTSHYKPTDVVTFATSQPELKQVTFVNDDVLTGKKLGKVEEIWYTAADGLKIQGWYMVPPDFDPAKKYPMQLHIHGGPHSMYGVGFNFGWQEMAAKGYVILFTNPRGSTGYGGAFGNAINNDYPGKDHDDLMAGVDVMLAKGFIDPQNLFITGCSGGGVLTAWAVTKTDRFAAAASNCTIVDWATLAGTTDGLDAYFRFEKLPWEDPTEWIKHSAIYFAGNVKTPTLLMTGVQDLRTPISQAELFYRALKFRKIPTALVRFNNEWHGTTSTPSNFARTQLYLRYWFDKYKRPASTSTAQ
jgi:dipeptidyl aminopeptidase/acylaminoacyl peptidase